MLNKINRLSMMTVGLMACICWAFFCVDASMSVRCKLKRHSHKVMQTDLNSRRCWDDVKIVSCWGYCLSYEISDWQFPYKESHHPVCVHGERRHASVKLRNCDPGVEPGTEIYHYVEAVNCRCQVCSSEDTSCEWLPPDSSLLGGLILKEELEEELE
ncbi:glycoprotein hormone beta 5 [Bombyx mori]|uniref:Glycoprotein hormone beta subunit-related protein n=1 Tax=Bombyx mori TaxID=7091 RepID=B3XYE2_BOMMO|nr:glycoprotein hormone beta 5 [Bombyx mori]XP_021203901.1 glycoprotein hormone beta 5 isoform X1 [Bombyx mori]XP_021203902.1 glycoprotein hormone beta 5 isoform X1 [Bombyx mori]BAG55001.1 glycoprotein hormone beta subunit-related protein [Bombyx mori]